MGREEGKGGERGDTLIGILKLAGFGHVLSVWDVDVD